ncbi:MAG: PHP domain-containing protein, partial [Gemmatimonadota bacterium]
MTAPYVELHCHSGYSFLDGASHPEELVLQARALGYPALALTDHDGLYGSMEFARFARSEGIQPVTGAEVTVDAGFHLTLLAETPAGYANLCRLLTRAHMGASERGEPRLPLPALLEHTEGLICLTGCRRSPLWAALGDSVAAAESLARRLARAFGPGSLFVELQDNRVRGDVRRLQALGSLADRLDLPVVATGNVHYHGRGRHRLQDALVAIRTRSTLDGS